jgi:hypothetical protein
MSPLALPGNLELEANVKLVVNRRIRGRRVLLVVASRPRRRGPGGVELTLVGAAAGAATCLIHRIGRRSGATDQETNAVLPGDEIVAHPRWESTRAITISAPVEEVWPWIVQMGFPAQRAGWYTPYVLDRLTFGIRERSAEALRPDLQRLEVGDRVPDSADSSVYFTVAEVDAPQALVLHLTRHLIKPIRTIDFSWAFVLRECGDKTRLLIRARTRYTPTWAWPFAELVVGPADFVNVSGMLRGIKRRSEGRHGTKSPRDEVGGSKASVQAVPQ